MRERLWHVVKTVLLTIGAFIVLAVAAWLVPNRWVTAHARETLVHGDLQLDWQATAIVPATRCVQDNYTDALIVGQAVYLGTRPLPEAVMLLPRYYDHEAESACLSLREALAGPQLPPPNEHYGRYWHGSTFATRLLMALFDYTQIRYLLYFVSSLLMLWVLARLWRCRAWAVAVSVGYALLVVNVFVMQFSMQYVMVLLVALVGMLLATYRQVRPEMVVAVMGTLTALFDLLTAPVLTLGLPLLVLTATRPAATVRAGLRRIVLLCAAWGLSYVAVWALKWGLATVVTGENVLAEAAEATGIRLSGQQAELQGMEMSRAAAVRRNVLMVSWPWLLVAVPLVGLLVAALMRPARRRGGQIVQYVAIAALPYLWYVVVANHSFVHATFTYRAQAVSIAALLMAALSMISFSNKGKQERL